MKIHFLNKLVIVLSLSSALLFMFSCNSDDTDIGLNLLPGSDKMSLLADTLDVDCFTVTDFAVSTDERTLTPLGSYNDPDFGFTKAGFVCHTRISSSNVDFSDVTEINSLELHLRYSSHYGDSSSVQNVNVYRLKKEIYFDSVYYSNLSLNPSQYEWLSSAVLSFDQSDSLAKITLPIELAQEFTNPLNKQHFVDNTTFIEFFNGLYVTTDDLGSGGCIFTLNLLNDDSRMVMYYNDTASYEFYINEKCAIINMFEHNFTSASTDVQQAIADTNALRDYCYIQSLGGLKTKIKFPSLASYFDSTNIAINKAQLIVSLKTGANEGTFAPPPKMTLVVVTETGSYDFIRDYKLNYTYFGGVFDNDDFTYRFNIPFHIQELLNGNEDYGIYLFASDNRTLPYRAIVHGNDESDKSMRLEIYYSKF